MLFYQFYRVYRSDVYRFLPVHFYAAVCHIYQFVIFLMTIKLLN